MAISYTIAKHAVCFPSKLKSSLCGHVFNIDLSADTDNGSIIARGDFVDLDRYEDDGEVSNFSAKVVKQAANGNWYVEVVTAGNALLIYQQPLIAEEYNNKFKKESNFYNVAGDTVRGYELSVGDVFEVSEDAFTVPANVAVNKTISTITNRKMVLAV